MADHGTKDDGSVLVDTGLLRIEQLRGPDQLSDVGSVAKKHAKKLRPYLKDDLAQRSLQPVTGDQVVFRVREVHTPDVTTARDVAGSTEQHAGSTPPPGSPSAKGKSSSSTSSTPRAPGPHVAVLGSPQVPVGLSSALGYLHLGQVARVKVPAHLLQQAVTSSAGTMQDIDPSADATLAVSYADEGGAAGREGGMALSHDQGASARVTDADVTQQQQLELSSHPIDVIEASKHGTVPVLHTGHTVGRSSSPVSDKLRRFDNPFHEQSLAPVNKHAQPQQQQMMQAHYDTSSLTVSQGVSTMTGKPSATAGRSSRVAAAAARAATTAQEDPIRRAVAAAMSHDDSTAEAASKLRAANGSNIGAAGDGVATAGITAAVGQLSRNRPLTAGNILEAPIVVGSTPPGSRAGSVTGTRSGRGESATDVGHVRAASPTASGCRSPVGVVLQPPAFGNRSGPSRDGAPPAAAGITSRHLDSAGRMLLDSSSTPAPTRLVNTSSTDAEQVTAAPVNRPASPVSSRVLHGFSRGDKGLNPDKGRSSGPQGVAFFTRISPQSSAEALLPGTPHLSPAVPGLGSASSRQTPQAGTATQHQHRQAPHQNTQATARNMLHSPTLGPSAAAAAGSTPASASAPGGTHNQSSSLDFYSGGSSAGMTPPVSDTPFYTPLSSDTPVATASKVVPGSQATSFTSRDLSSCTSAASSAAAAASARTAAAAAGAGNRTPLHSPVQDTTGTDSYAVGGRMVAENNASGAYAAGGRASGLDCLMPNLQQGSYLKGSAAIVSGGSASSMSRRSRAEGRADDNTVQVGTARNLRFEDAGRAGAHLAAASQSRPNKDGRSSRRGSNSTEVLQAAADKLRGEVKEAGVNSTGAIINDSTATTVHKSPGPASAVSEQLAVSKEDAVQRLRQPPAALMMTGSNGALQQHGSGDAGPVSFAKWLPPQGGSGKPGDLMAAAAALAAAQAGSSAAGNASVVAVPETVTHTTEAGVSVALCNANPKEDLSALSPTGSDKNDDKKSHCVPPIGPPVAASYCPTLFSAATTNDAGCTGMDAAPHSAASDQQQHSVKVTHMHEDTLQSLSTAGVGPVKASDGDSSAHGLAASETPDLRPDSGEVSRYSGAQTAVDVQPMQAASGSEDLPVHSEKGQGVLSPSKAAAAATLSAIMEVVYPRASKSPAEAEQAQPVSSEAGTCDSKQQDAAHDVSTESRSPSTTRDGNLPAAPKLPGTSYEGTMTTPQQGAAATKRASAASGVPPAGTVQEASAGAENRFSAEATGSACSVEHSPDGSSIAAASSTEAATADGRAASIDRRVEYEVEVLAVIPGHGPLSGQPVLSTVAQQEHISRTDIQAAATAAVNREPELKPPKPRTGVSGWVRRHMSLNIQAPWRAGKAGLGMFGLRHCFTGHYHQRHHAEQQQQG